MPELPEVETIRRYLAQVLPGKTIRQVQVLAEKQLADPEKLVGRKIVRLERQGKQLAFILDRGILLVHLKLTGQLVYVPQLNPQKRAIFGHPIPFAGGNSLPGKSTRVIIYFAGDQGHPDGALFFNDVRMFGWLRLISQEEWQKQRQALGVDAISPQFTAVYLYQVLQRTRRAVKIVLMDQTKIAGIGNIYANEALFRAGIDPRRPANSLSQEEAKRLWQAIKDVLAAGLKFHGASAADDAYIQPDGQPGQFQQKLAVYQRAGQPCPHCGGTVQRIQLGGRGTFFCPRCQK